MGRIGSKRQYQCYGDFGVIFGAGNSYVYKELRAHVLSEKLVQIICITSHIYELVSVTIKIFGFSTEFGHMTNFGNLPLNFVFVFFS